MATVIDNADRNTILIDGKEYDAVIGDVPCPACKELRIYSYEYDAFFCAHCNEWVESTCSDPTCEFCAKRPSTPIFSPVADQQ